MNDHSQKFLVLTIIAALVFAIPMAAQDAGAHLGVVATVQYGQSSGVQSAVSFHNTVRTVARHCGAYATSQRHNLLWHKRVIDTEACAADPSTVYSDTTTHNLVTNAGFLAIAKAISDTSTQPASANYIALACDDCSGSNTATVAAGDTALSTSGTSSTEITDHGLARAQGTAAFSVGSDPKVYTVSKVFTSTTGSISANKVGLFNASSGPTLYYEAAFTKVTLNGTNGDTLTVN